MAVGTAADWRCQRGSVDGEAAVARLRIRWIGNEMLQNGEATAGPKQLGCGGTAASVAELLWQR